ncbi:hypothetical protein DFH06DRAFT_1129500 [Mycena polygramma]|nr:hypothetical protein DFH06DRAFT_1129500 [Mycena polygramma]
MQEIGTPKAPEATMAHLYRCPMNKLPAEIITMIVEILAYCDDGSSLAVVQAATATSAFSQICSCVRYTCLTFGPTWANINLFLSDWRPRVRQPLLHEFQERLKRSRNSPLRICFGVRLCLLLHGDYIGDQVWSELIRCRHRWSVLHLHGSSSCRPPFVCAKAVAFSALLSAHSPQLKFVSLSSTNRDHHCQSNHAGQVVVDLNGLQRLTSYIPFSVLHHIDNLPDTGTLVYLDIQNQPDVSSLFKHVPNLETLIWRANGAVPQGPPVVLPRLIQLFIHSLRVPPPIIAENLVELLVEDPHYPLDAATFNSLVGNPDTVTKLRYLNIMSNNDITNSDLLAIWDKCRFLHRFAFPSSPRDQTRTELYREVGDQVAKNYVLNSRYRLKSIKCHGRPTRQPGQDLYDFISRLGETGPDFCTELHFDIWRLLCGPCHGRFNVRDSGFLEMFKEENHITSDLVLIAMYERYLKPQADVQNPFSLVLVFTSLEAASKTLKKGVIFRSKRCEWVKELDWEEESKKIRNFKMLPIALSGTNLISQIEFESKGFDESKSHLRRDPIGTRQPQSAAHPHHRAQHSATLAHISRTNTLPAHHAHVAPAAAQTCQIPQPHPTPTLTTHTQDRGVADSVMFIILSTIRPLGTANELAISESATKPEVKCSFVDRGHSRCRKRTSKMSAVKSNADSCCCEPNQLKMAEPACRGRAKEHVSSTKQAITLGTASSGLQEHAVERRIIEHAIDYKSIRALARQRSV